MKSTRGCGANFLNYSDQLRHLLRVENPFNTLWTVICKRRLVKLSSAHPPAWVKNRQRDSRTEFDLPSVPFRLEIVKCPFSRQDKVHAYCGPFRWFAHYANWR